MRKAILASVVALAFPASASADWSFSTHIVGPTMPHGPALHVGRFYYHHNNASGRSGTDTGELGRWLHEERKLKKERCKVLHAEYFARHGVTTPGPLQRFHGCDKWARDAAYWRARHNEIHPHTETIPQALTSALRNFFAF